jgi:hypothetical protein
LRQKKRRSELRKKINDVCDVKMPEFSRLVSSREKLQLVRSCKFSKGFLLGRKQQ